MGWGENDRGVSFTFGAEVVAKFLHKHDFDLICRAHQVNSRHGKIVFLFWDLDFIKLYSLRWSRMATSSLLRGSWSLFSQHQTTAESLTTQAS